MGGLRRRVLLVSIGPDNDPHYAQICRAQATKRRDNSVMFLPALSSVELTRYYAAADVLLMPSSVENFSMAVAEAMASGLPVAVTRSVPLYVDVEQYKAGVVLRSRTAEAVWAVLEEACVAGPRAFRDRYTGGPTCIRQRYSPSALTPAYIALASEAARGAP